MSDPRGVDRSDLCAELEDDVLFGEDALKLLRQFAVETRRDAIEHFNHGHIRAETPPDRAELKADIAGADDEQALGHFRQRQRAGGGNDARLVDVDAGNAGDLRAGGDDDLLGLDNVLFAVDEGDLDLAWAEDTSRAVEMIDLVLLEQEIDALDIALDGFVLETQHGGRSSSGFTLMPR